MGSDPVILNPLVPAFYGRTNQVLIRRHDADLQALAEEWDDEASQAALASNPARAQYLYYMTERLLGR